jgi:hypothetical protein
VFLEIVTWLLKGTDVAQDGFTKERTEPGLNEKFYEDTFFSLKRAASGEVFATKKSKITAWINKLRKCPEGSAYTDQFLDLIDKQMLVPMPEERASSREVCKELSKMNDGCRVDSSYTRSRELEGSYQHGMWS